MNGRFLTSLCFVLGFLACIFGLAGAKKSVQASLLVEAGVGLLVAGAILGAGLLVATAIWRARPR